MKVKADHWVNLNGVWFAPGETYEDGTHEIAENTPPEKDAEPPVKGRGGGQRGRGKKASDSQHPDGER